MGAVSNTVFRAWRMYEISLEPAAALCCQDNSVSCCVCGGVPLNALSIEGKVFKRSDKEFFWACAADTPRSTARVAIESRGIIVEIPREFQPPGLYCKL
jgi:hypothetical protein